MDLDTFKQKSPEEKQEIIAKLRTKRAPIAKEILGSEKIYVENLHKMIEYFLKPLRSKGPALGITDANVKAIFGNIEMIYAYNKELLKEIEEKVTNWNDEVEIGETFLNLIQYMKMYQNYVQYYNNGRAILIKLRRHPDAGKFLQKLDSQKETGKQILKDFLIMPVQRIPRYIMLLQQLFKNTWPTHSDYLKLREAHHKLIKVAKVVEEAQNVADNLNKMIEIQDTLKFPSKNITTAANIKDGLDANDFHLIQPQRKFVREGRLYEVKSRLDQPVYVFLFSDVLMITKSKKGGMKHVKRIITLSSLVSIKPHPDKPKRMLVILLPVGKQKEIIFKCDKNITPWLHDVVLCFTKARAVTYGLKHMCSKDTKIHRHKERNIRLSLHNGSSIPSTFLSPRAPMSTSSAFTKSPQVARGKEVKKMVVRPRLPPKRTASALSIRTTTMQPVKALSKSTAIIEDDFENDDSYGEVDTDQNDAAEFKPDSPHMQSPKRATIQLSALPRIPKKKIRKDVRRYSVVSKKEQERAQRQALQLEMGVAGASSTSKTKVPFVRSTSFSAAETMIRLMELSTIDD